MKIAIIGAGAAGLDALRHSLKANHDCEVYEKTDKIGGTWVFTDKVGLDTNGLPIHSSMYAGLKTNLPKELMGYEDYPYKTPQHSYITPDDVLQYINDFATEYNLFPHIKFLKHVVKVRPISNNKWSIKVEDLKSKVTTEKEYDAVFVCVGHYSIPNQPDMPGLKNFEGHVMHSHSYRYPEPFTKKKVLIIGNGSSGVDIARIVNSAADKVVISKRSGNLPSNFPEAIIVKPEISEFKKNSVKFKDDSEETIDTVIYCTGYLNSFPFLSPECQIEVENNWVKYLYKHIVNVNFPTMAFLGIPPRIFPFPIYGIQVRFFLSLLQGNFSITKEQMMESILQDVQKKKDLQMPMHKYHSLLEGQGPYMDDLADTAKVKRVPPVLYKLYKNVHSLVNADRTNVFRIINDEEFEEVKI